MTITGFAARADIVGRRVRVAWEFVPDAGESLADVPPLVLRRKPRDYEFPPAPTNDDLVYDASAFPPAPVLGALSVTDLDGWETIADGERRVYEPISVAVPANGRFVEVLRCTTVTVFDLSGVALRQRVEIIDVGAQPGALQPNEFYYYQLFGRDLPSSGSAADPYRSAAMVTDCYGLNRTFYQMLPEVYRRQDVTTPPVVAGSATVPELNPVGGQLRRFVDLFGIALDSLRGTAEGLLALHDVDRVAAPFLEAVAHWIGWDLSVDVEIPLRRNELKTANRLYNLVGTLPGIRALVTQYTGWFTQVAEFAQHIALANQPPRRSLYAITPSSDGVSWHGSDDAADLLGFAAPHQDASGAPAQAATLTGTAPEPFPLRPGMSLTLAVDGLLPATVRFGRGDFADIAQATAAEVATVINRNLPEVQAQAVGGKLKIASDTVGPQSLLEVVPAAASLITLESAPTGRLSAPTDTAGRIRLFYEAWGTPTPPGRSLAPTGAPTAAETGNYVLRQVRYKTFVDGAWRDSHPLFAERVTPQADPAALVLPDGRVWAVWLDNPQTPAARLRWALGAARAPLPARVLGRKTEPFTLTNGATLTLVGHWTGLERYTVHAADFADITRATATELVAAINAQLTHTQAVREKNGSVSLATLATGAPARLAIDLSRSTTARALGFDPRNAVGSPGSWSEQIDWSAPLDAVSLGPGLLAELAATNDPAGGVRLAWAAHHDGLWRVVTTHWDDRTLAGTANGLFLRSGAGPWAPVAGLPSSDVRAIAVDANGTAWIATAAGVALRRPDGSIAPPVPALPLDDIRDLVLGPDGTTWLATGAGLAIVAANGMLSILTTADGLPTNDVRALALAGDGTLWLATAAGAVRRDPGGSLDVFSTAAGLPSNTVQAVALGPGGTVYLATTAGLAISAASGFAVVDGTRGLGASDARAVAVAADGTLWVATAGGVSRQSPAGAWSTLDIARGLASDDTRSLAFAADGTAWVGTAVGFCTIAPGGTVTRLDLIGGGAVNPAGRAVHTGWAAPLELAGNPGGNREPFLAIDANSRTWLLWSSGVGVANPGASWGLRYRTYDPTTRTWDLETVLTAPPNGGRASDRTPAAQPVPAGMRVHFASDRRGGFSLYSVDVDMGGAVGPLVPLPEQASSDLFPTPLAVGNALWLLFRSDANVSLAQTGSPPWGDEPARSARAPDNGAIRRYSGTVAADLNDLNRLRTRGVFGDLLSYTPNRPDGAGMLTEIELYTRGTVGLYVSRANQGAELTRQQAGRLNALLQRFIPINLRAVAIVVEAVDVEVVDPTGHTLQDSYSDDYPFFAQLGPVTDSAAAAMPGLSLLHSNLADNVSASPADLTTLARRTYFPPLQ
jgi:phage tail-like protein